MARNDLGKSQAMYAKALDRAVLSEFLQRVPKCGELLKTYSQDGNEKMIAALDAQLQRAFDRKGKWAEVTQD